jgi:threonine dehydrogenase-like Zn-dependent dehydrogenase
MRAMTVRPGQKQTADIEEVPHPDKQDGTLLVRGMAIGICGTDREIADGAYGTPPSGEERLIIGHESLGEVLEAPAGSGFAPGDLVVGIVRRPDPVPCPACAAGEWDMCRTDGFGERGIVRLHGYGSEHWRVEPDFAVPILPRLGEALATADSGWLGGLITRRVPLTSWTQALDRHPEDIKVVVDLTA